MKLNTKVRYATRAMVELAERFGQGPVRLSEVAQRQEISEKYLESLLAILRSNGLVRGQRGARGGYMLTRSPEEITLRDIYESLEGREALVPCTLDVESCPRHTDCVTQEVWAELYEVTMHVLETKTLADLVHRRQECTPHYSI